MDHTIDWTVPPLDYSPQRKRPSTSSNPTARVHFEIEQSRALDCRKKRLSSLEQRVRAKTAGLLSKSLESEIAHANSQLPYTKAYCESRNLLSSGNSDRDSSSSNSLEAVIAIAKEDGPFSWLLLSSKNDWAVKPHYYTPSLACYQTFGEPQKPTRWSISSASDTEECDVEWDNTDGHVIVRGFGPLPANSDPPSPKRRNSRQSQPLMDLQSREDEAELHQSQRETAAAAIEKMAALQAHQLRKREAQKLRSRRELQREMRKQVIDKSRQTDTVKLTCSHLANHNAQVSAKTGDMDEAIASSSDEDDDAITVIDYKETSKTEAEARLAMYRATAVQA